MTAMTAFAQSTWGDIEYHGEPWVQNISRPNDITHGLQDRHLAVWASHGRYYDQKEGCWRWQRPFLFGTTEDLFTQTIVVPYLIPMLENAGAVVFTPRERDWQRNEIIVDNDDATPYYYYEKSVVHNWQQAPQKGFAKHDGVYYDGENPFEAGTARVIKTTRKANKASFAAYQPRFPEEGRYAVYVSYQTLPNSVPDAEYIVFHQGQQTKFRVNQRMGDGTWVYLGSFDFDEGYSEFNRVVLTSVSNHDGVITTDAVRFGGGMGNITRGGSTSGFARSFEGARYYAQWAGAPYYAYSSKNGENDYGDDINVRSLMTNWLAGGSPYVPNTEGKLVPIELTLAVHSDAGFNPDGKSVWGPLAICTTNFNEGKLAAGISRQASHHLADEILSGEVRDLSKTYGFWPRRDFYDRNYSETRVPAVPSAIIEMLSHQSFPDMRYGLDPHFRFTFARSMYKSILRFVAEMHGEKSYTVQPLTPSHFNIEFLSKDKVKLSWEPVSDPLEKSAKPTGYNVYTAVSSGGFDNGRHIHQESLTMKLEPGKTYHFRVTATNSGGESFPSEVLSACYQPEAKQTVLIVNGFNRLSPPAFIDNDSLQGVDLYADPGVSYGLTAGWCGYQQFFDKKKMGIEGPGGLGYSGQELQGQYIAGNSFNYVSSHADAIASAHCYNIVSCSDEALESGKVNLKHIDCIDLILGLEKSTTSLTDSVYAPTLYKLFSQKMQKVLNDFTSHHGSLLVSGAYITSDMTAENDQKFLASTLKVQPAIVTSSAGEAFIINNRKPLISGMGTSFDFYNTLNDKHYAATTTDILNPVQPAYCALQYAEGSSAAVAYQGTDYRSFTVGFPLECIKNKETRNSIIRGIMQFLLVKKTQ